MRTASFVGHKGGVGKSTLARKLAKTRAVGNKIGIVLSKIGRF